MHQNLWEKLETFTKWENKKKEECWNLGKIVSIQEVNPNKRYSHKFDIQIEDNSNYFVDDVLVHNSPEVTTGGKALEYYASIRLRVAQAGKIEETVNGEKVVKAIETKITTVKNKCFAPYKSCTNVIVFGKGIDNDAGILDMAINEGVIQKKGGWYAINGSNVAQGLANLKVYLEENKEIYEEIKNKVKEISNNKLKEAGEVEDNSNEADGMTDDEIADKITKETETGEV